MPKCEELDYEIGSRQQEYRKRDETYRERESKRGQARDRKVDLWAKPFIGWDSEGDNRDASLFLFGNNLGGRIAHPKISTIEIFELILETERRNPNAIHIIFGGEYDFNMFLRDVPMRCLLALRDTGHTRWKGYRISHLSRKWFTISNDRVSAQIFDVQLFFGTSYVHAITEHEIGTIEERERIAAGKAERKSFTFDDLDYIEPYWRTELKLLPQLANKLRDAFFRAGMFITSWHGPGALARNILTNHNVKECMAKTPVEEAARYAFCGGRFESFKAGLYEGTVYNYDINSAYPYAATFLPDLSVGEWEYVAKVDRDSIDPHQFAVYHISYVTRNTDGFAVIREPKPLFRRFFDDRVMWPNTVTGWYWSPEAALVADDPHATFIEGYVFHDSGARPFAFLQEYYDIRKRLQDQNDPMQLSFKLGPNSVYGQLAQRAGWQRKHEAPKFHQLEWAGYVTSTCRAMAYSAGRYAWENDGLISIDTDGIYSTVQIPDTAEYLPNGIGSNLGQWGMDTLSGVLYWQSGVFYIPTSDEPMGWKLKKSRGAPRGQIPASGAFRALGTLSPLEYMRTEFIGYRWALRNDMSKWRYFVDTKPDKPRTIEFGGSKASKRWHNQRACRKCKGIGDDSMHDLYPQSNLMIRDNHSKMHHIPWLENDHDKNFDVIDEKSGLIIDQIWLDERAELENAC